MIVIIRIFMIGLKSHNIINSTICYGVATYITLHVIVNLTGVLGLVPLTGVPLPFMSYGGSFTICLIAALTLVQRVSFENEVMKEKRKKNA